MATKKNKLWSGEIELTVTLQIDGFRAANIRAAKDTMAWIAESIIDTRPIEKRTGAEVWDEDAQVQITRGPHQVREED